MIKEGLNPKKTNIRIESVPGNILQELSTLVQVLQSNHSYAIHCRQTVKEIFPKESLSVLNRDIESGLSITNECRVCIS